MSVKDIQVRLAEPFREVSWGTLRTEDLLTAFADELERLAGPADKIGAPLGPVITDAREVDPDSEDAVELVVELADALQEYAPPYCTFGAHEGDGSSFGFWPSVDALMDDAYIGEVTRIADGSEPVPGCMCVAVNDHGNVTLYGADGSVIWDCV